MFPRALLLALMLALVVGSPAAAGPAPAAAARPAAQTYAAPGDPVKWYRVQPSYNGEPEYLYEIAERFLGDGDRLDEIYVLNRDRVQPDGARLTVPDVIESGWVLQLPADADGPGLEYGPLPGGPSAVPAASPLPPAAAVSQGGGGVRPVLLTAGLLLVLAGFGLAVWLVRRRGTTPATASGVVVPRRREGGPARPFDAAASWTIDRALRVLATSAAAAGRPVPPVLRVSVDENWIGLRLAEPREEPCEPWEVREQGRLWVATLRSLQALPAGEGVTAPCPRLVTLGTNGGTRELVDLGRVPGPVGLRGEAGAARELLAAWAAELTGSPWSPGVRVVAGGLLPEVGDTGAVLSRPGLDQAVELATGGDRPGAPAGEGLPVLLLGAAPADRDADRIRDLVTRADRPWAVVVLGRTRPEGLQLTLRPDGRLETGALGLTVGVATPAGLPGRA